MRKRLVTIQKISKLTPIPGADRIEIAECKGLGWQVIVSKEQFKVGQKCIFYEIDSFLPEEPRYEFLRDSSHKQFVDKGEVKASGYRIRTRKLRGVISQGLILPVTEFPRFKELPVGTDVTEELNVQHHDELVEKYNPARQKGVCNVTGCTMPFPSFCPKSDQERIQNHMEYFETFKDVTFVGEQKYDGSSITIYCVAKELDPDMFGVCSRNFKLKRSPRTRWELFKTGFMLKCKCNPVKGLWIRLKRAVNMLTGKIRNPFENAYWNAVNSTDIERKLRDYHKKTGRNLCIQAELVGPGVNGNRDKYEALTIFAYDVFDCDSNRYLDPDERVILLKSLDIQQVNRVYKGKFFHDYDFEGALKFVDRKTLRGNPAEGVVFKSQDRVPYVSFKIINNNYLLKE